MRKNVLQTQLWGTANCTTVACVLILGCAEGNIANTELHVCGVSDIGSCRYVYGLCPIKNRTQLQPASRCARGAANFALGLR